jgi:putative PIN family toxin of toxin-antitoxin system
MRVLLDTNILISYLLRSRSDSAPAMAVEAAYSGAFTLLIAGEILSELRRKVTTKSFLAERIAETDLDALATLLEQVAEKIPEIHEEMPAMGPDRKDDYVIAYAAVGRADILVTGDEDLLSLGELAGLNIVSPARFLELLAPPPPLGG